MSEPELSLITLLSEAWGLDFKPSISSNWYKSSEETMQVTVAHVLTRPESIGFSSTPTESTRRFRAVYSIDVWSRGDRAKRWSMLKEVDRIIHSYCILPGGDIDFAEVSEWRDLDEPGHPSLYRSQVRVEVTYYD